MIPIPTNIPYKLIGGIVGVLLVVGAFGWLIHSRDSWRDTANTNEQLYHGEQAAHQLTVANYRAKAEEARKADAANVARKDAENRALNERTSSEYEARIADARARAGRLRQQASVAPSDSGRSGTAVVSAVPSPSSGATQAPAQGGLSANDALTATEQAIQLDALISWVEEHLKSR